MPTVDDVMYALPPEFGARLSGVRQGSDGTITVTGITHDSRRVHEDWMFACLRGANADGHSFAGAAVARGATALLVDERGLTELGDDAGVVRLVVDDTRIALGMVASTIYATPSDGLQVIGVTGTNGKTTTTAMIAAILRAGGTVTDVIGTLGGVHTTPEAPDLQQRLRTVADNGGAAVVMEVSSHGLELHRVDGTTFAAAVFTNLGHDHLDLHGTQQNYFRAKARLFEAGRSRIGICNVDDAHGRLLYEAAEIDMAAFSAADATDVDVKAGSIDFTWRGVRLHVPIGGAFNVLNALAAATTARALGIADRQIRIGLAALDVVPGRFEHVGGGTGGAPTVIVDFAHTPDGLAELARAARPLVADGGALVIVFGAGGDRDHAKRPEMGRVVAAAADRVVITSDNPRSEDPDAIIGEVVAGIPTADRGRVTSITDRRMAIGEAIGSATLGDVVIIAGKGHEQTQTIGTTALPFDDRTVARQALAAAHAWEATS